MGREMGLNPAVILLSLSVWGSLLGIIGMIIALPVTALLMSYYVKYISEPTQRDSQSQPQATEGGSAQSPQ
ncbi:MAG: AI-2E family transporter, partial [Muribaculaceae bacterium]|nr:AI-2E family transporter [Muribaculaceae bacterium]